MGKYIIRSRNSNTTWNHVETPFVVSEGQGILRQSDQVSFHRPPCAYWHTPNLSLRKVAPSQASSPRQPPSCLFCPNLPFRLGPQRPVPPSTLMKTLRFFRGPATTEIYSLSLFDALPI